MMILSRIWYVILALFLAAAYYVVSLAVGQYNRRNHAAMDETLKADSQVVSWAMQVDARRRLDVLLLAAADPAVGKALKGANGKEQIPPASKEEGAKGLRAFNDKLHAEYKNDVVFLADREGRLVSQVGYDQLAAYPEFELGGYAAVFDALHGFLRDDTWVLGGRIARVVTRPVEDEVGQAPIGAVVALRWVDKGFAKDIGKRTRTNIAFFALGQGVASAATTEGFEEQSLEALGGDLAAVAQDKGFKELGRTEVRDLGAGDRGGVIFVRLPGDGWELGAGFAVARPKVSIAGPLGFVSGADDQDKRNVKLWAVLAIVVGASLFGILFSFLEHSLPMSELKRQAEKLKKGELDVLQLPRFRAGYRLIAGDLNQGMQRVIEKGGGAGRKPADLESILGPVPAQPSMSAFAFPLSPAAGGESPQTPHRFPGATGPALPPSRPGGPPPPPNARPGTPGPGVPAAASQSGVRLPPALDRTMAMPSGSPNHGVPFAVPTSTQPATTPAFVPVVPAGGAALAQVAPQGSFGKDEEEQTMVHQPSADLIAATSSVLAAEDPTADWPQVYQEFLKTKHDCKEPIEGLTFEKFQQTLKKNRDALMQRHGCKRVKFAVYVKEGRASLKATPVRD